MHEFILIFSLSSYYWFRDHHLVCRIRDEVIHHITHVTRVEAFASLN